MHENTLCCISQPFLIDWGHVSWHWKRRSSLLLMTRNVTRRCFSCKPYFNAIPPAPYYVFSNSEAQVHHPSGNLVLQSLFRLVYTFTTAYSTFNQLWRFFKGVSCQCWTTGVPSYPRFVSCLFTCCMNPSKICMYLGLYWKGNNAVTVFLLWVANAGSVMRKHFSGETTVVLSLSACFSLELLYFLWQWLSCPMCKSKYLYLAFCYCLFFCYGTLKYIYFF